MVNYNVKIVDIIIIRVFIHFVSMITEDVNNNDMQVKPNPLIVIKKLILYY